MVQISETDERCIAQIICALRFMIDVFADRAINEQEQIIVNEAFAALCFTPTDQWHIANEIENSWNNKIIKKGI